MVKPVGYWTLDNTLNELKEVIVKLGYVPPYQEFAKINRCDLLGAIDRHGGISKFRTLLGYELLKKPKGYWTYENTLKELKEVIIKLGHFPTQRELDRLNRTDLINAIRKHGGANKLRTTLGCEIIQNPKGYWTLETTQHELKEIMAKFGHFPTHQELADINRFDILGAMAKYGGTNKLRILLGYETTYKPDGYWTYENTLNELKEVIAKLGHFPTHQELNEVDKKNISSAIRKFGGINKFRTLLGYDVLRKSDGYWTLENTLKELKEVIVKLGHFPTQQELTEVCRNDLITAITRNGGTNKFRTLLGYELIQNPTGYWTDENILKGLKEVIAKLDNYPTHQDLKEMGRTDLSTAITLNGGTNKFRTIQGYSVSFREKHRGEIQSYLVRKGKGSERLIKKVLIEWCRENNRPTPTCNVKLTKGNVIEFVCHSEKRVGIDVTNTKWGNGVYRKWAHKDYYKHLDELWVVVFSSGVRESTYNRWNKESPDNVKVMSIFTFLEELDYAADEYTKSKIKDYIACSFHTKNELKGKYDCGSVQVTLDV